MSVFVSWENIITWDRIRMLQCSRSSQIEREFLRIFSTRAIYGFYTCPVSKLTKNTKINQIKLKHKHVTYQNICRSQHTKIFQQHDWSIVDNDHVYREKSLRNYLKSIYLRNWFKIPVFHASVSSVYDICRA